MIQVGVQQLIQPAALTQLFGQMIIAQDEGLSPGLTRHDVYVRGDRVDQRQGVTIFHRRIEIKDHALLGKAIGLPILGTRQREKQRVIARLRHCERGLLPQRKRRFDRHFLGIPWANAACACRRPVVRVGARRQLFLGLRSGRNGIAAPTRNLQILDLFFRRIMDPEGRGHDSVFG